MSSNVQHYSQLAEQTVRQITGSYQDWTAFLTTAARLYKYPYHEQLMIFAQRPHPPLALTSSCGTRICAAMSGVAPRALH